MNAVYPVSLLYQIYHDSCFYGFEHDEEKISLYLLCVSETHFCMFYTKQQPHYLNEKLTLPSEKAITECRLVFWAEIGSLIEMKIERNRST